MKRVLLAILAVVFFAGAVNASQIVTYGWEDGGTILGSYGNLVDPENVTGIANTGYSSLKVTESPHDGTPQAYIGFVTGLTDGDVIDASFFGYDETSGTSPSLRIWGHYADSDDVTIYAGSAGGNYTYTSGIGWEEIGYSWTFDSSSGTRDALVIEARLYSSPTTGDYSTDYWIDDLTITVSSDTANIITPSAVPIPAAFLLLSSGLAAVIGIRRKKA